MPRLGPDVCHHKRFTVPSNRVFKHVSELGLSVGCVLAVLVAESHDDLLEKGKTLVDV